MVFPFPLPLVSHNRALTISGWLSAEPAVRHESGKVTDFKNDPFLPLQYELWAAAGDAGAQSCLYAAQTGKSITTGLTCIWQASKKVCESQSYLTFFFAPLSGQCGEFPFG